MHKNSVLSFEGVMDNDSADALIRKGDYRNGIGIRSGIGSKPGSIILDKGNVEVPITLPDGTNKCVGTYEDKHGQSIIYFIHNSNNNHSIYRYYPDKVTGSFPYGQIELIAQGSKLEFTGDIITQIRLIDLQFLCWADGRSRKFQITGVPPKMIDIQRSDLNNKLRQYEFYNSFTDYSGTYTRKIFDADGVEISTQTFSVTDTITEPADIFQSIANSLNGSPTFQTYAIAEACDCKVIITMLASGTSVTLTAGNSNGVLVPVNHYVPLDDIHVDLIKHPPVYEPICTHRTDSDFAANFIADGMFQFRVRYYYHDNVASAWGPISNIPVNINVAGQILTGANYLEIDLNDSRLNTASGLNAIRKVEIAFREGNTGLFKTADIINVCDLDYGSNKYRFYNDKIYSTVASDENLGGSETQVLKLFDNVPQIAAAMELISDQDGNTLLAVGAGRENYTVDSCGEIALSLEYPSQSMVCEPITITGRIDIFRESFQPSAGSREFQWPDNGASGNESKVALDGFVVYLAGTEFYGISDNFLTGATGAFQIEGVPPGKYIMRVASYKARFDDSAGPKYNINRGLDYQRTSSPVIDCAGSTAATGIVYERELDLTGESGTFDLLTEAGYGPITIHDLGVTDDFEVIVTEGYLIDNEGTAGQAAASAGIGVELQSVFFEIFRIPASGGFTATSIQKITDCNGYFYSVHNRPAGGLAPFANAYISSFQFSSYDTADEVSGAEKVYTSVTGYHRDFLFAEDVFSALSSGTATSGQADPYTIWVMHNEDGDFSTQNKTYVEGTVTDGNGDPLQDVVVVISRNGRQMVTGSSGTYSIPIHVAYASSEASRREDTIFFVYPADSCYEFPPVPDSIDFDIGDFYYDYNSTTPYEDQDSQLVLLTEPIKLEFKTLKRGGQYQVGIVYEDRANRKSTVSLIKSIQIPFHTEDGRYGPYYVVWQINTIPPVWATHYRVVRTRDSVYSRYQQIGLPSVQYVTVSDADAAPVSSTFGSGTHVLLQINPEFLTNPDSSNILFFYRDLETNGFEPQRRDRVRLILDDGGLVLDQMYDYEIVGVYSSSGDYFAVIENTGEVEIKAGFLVELYTPKLSTERVYYEQGDTYPILDAGTEDRLHGGQRQNQTDVLPAEGYLMGGDTYWRRKNFVVGPNIDGLISTENESLSDSFDSNNEDIGRPNAHDPNFAQRLYYNRIRVSDIYIPSSQINGIGSFRSLEYQDINRTFGAIQFLEMIGQVMVAVCEFKLQPIYISKGQVVDLSGSTLLARTDRLLNVANDTISDLGTQHPESVAVHNGSLFAMDSLQGIPWRFSQAGQQPINDKQIRFFNSLARLVRNDSISVRFLGEFDREHDQYVLSYTIGGSRRTMCYSLESQGWKTLLPFYPEKMGHLGKIFVTFSAGGLWVHGVNSAYMNYYGVQEDAQLQFVMNEEATVDKDFHTLSLFTRYPWIAPLITTPINLQYTSVQTSKLLVDHFSNYQSRQEAEFRRDVTDPEFADIADTATREARALLAGRPLKNFAITVQIVPIDSSLPHELISASVGYTPSMETKP